MGTGRGVARAGLRTRICSIVGLVALVGTVAVGVAPGAGADPGDASIIGRVVDDLGQPLEGVSVSVCEDDFDPCFSPDPTDANGEFTLESLDSGTAYRAEALSSPGHWTSVVTTDPLLVGENDVGDIVVLRTEVISGTVTDGVDPIEGASIDAACVSELDPCDVSNFAISDENGDYSFELPAGVYSLYVQASGHSAQSREVTLELGSPLDEDFALDVAATLTVTVVDAVTDAPIEDAAVQMCTTGVQPCDFVGFGNFTVTPGEYLVEIAPGDYRIEVYAPGYATGVLEYGPLTAGANDPVEIALEQNGTISGTVTDGVDPLEGAFVAACPGDDPCTLATSVGFLTTDANGQYSLAAPPGTYRVDVSRSGYTGAFQTGIEVESGQETSGVDFVLESTAGTLSGTVVSSVTSNGIGGVAVTACLVSEPACSSSAIETFTNEDGDFLLTVPVPGTYNILFSEEDHDTPVAVENVDIPTGSSSLPEPVVLDPLALVSGQVRDTENAGLAGAKVLACAEGTQPCDPGDPGYKEALAFGEFGTWFLKLPAGTYHLEPRLYGYSGAPQTATLAVGEVAGADFTMSLLATGSISGDVVDKDDDAIDFATVSLCTLDVEPCDNLVQANTTGVETPPPGHYEIADVPVGTYRVEISAPNHVTKVIDDVEVTEGVDTDVSAALVEFATVSGEVTLGANVEGTTSAGVGACPVEVPLSRTCFGLITAFSPQNGGAYELRLPPGDYNLAAFAERLFLPLIYSAPVSFTLGDGEVIDDLDFTISDEDADGVDSGVEDGAPNGGDGNDDDTPDSEQAHVASLLAANDAGYVTVAAPEGTELVGVTVVNPATLPDPPVDLELPAGLVSWTLNGIPEGDDAVVELFLPDVTGLDAYWKFHDGAWIDATSVASFGSSTVTLTITDGGFGDDDGIENGSVTDPGGPAETEDEPTTGSFSGRVADGDDADLEGASVRVCAQGADPCTEDNDLASATSGADGTYQIADIEAGAYRVDAAKGGYSGDSRSEVVVQPGEDTPDVDFTLAEIPTTGGITGTVRGGANQPLAGAAVRACADPGAGQPCPGATVPVFTGIDGGYTVSNLSPGAYRVEVLAPPREGAAAQPVTVTAGEDTTRDFTIVYRRPDARIRTGTSGPVKGNDLYNSTGSNQSVTKNQKRGTTAVFTLPIQNDGDADDSYTVKGIGGTSGKFTIDYYAGSTKITSKVKSSAGYSISNLAAGGNKNITMKVKVFTSAKKGSEKAVKVTVKSKSLATAVDAVVGKTKAT